MFVQVIQGHTDAMERLAEVGRAERERATEADPRMQEILGLMTHLRYHDLRDPWLHSP